MRPVRQIDRGGEAGMQQEACSVIGCWKWMVLAATVVGVCGRIWFRYAEGGSYMGVL